LAAADFECSNVRGEGTLGEVDKATRPSKRSPAVEVLVTAQTLLVALATLAASGVRAETICRPAAVAVFDLDELGNPDMTKVHRGAATLCWSIDSAGFLKFSIRMPNGDTSVSLRLPNVKENFWVYVIKGADGEVLVSESLTFRKDGSVSAASRGSKSLVLAYTEVTAAQDGGKR
jgi:hypothetical protein